MLCATLLSSYYVHSRLICKILLNLLKESRRRNNGCMWDVSEVRINAGFFRDPNRFVYCQEEIHCGQNYCGKSCYCQYYPAITDILQKILEYLSKNNYTTVLNLFFELTDSSKYSIFRYHHALHGQLILHQMSQHLCHSSNQPFSNGPTLTVPVGTGKK